MRLNGKGLLFPKQIVFKSRVVIGTTENAVTASSSFAFYKFRPLLGHHSDSHSV